MSRRTPRRALTAAERERFWSKVDRTGPCWLWIAGCFNNGYAAFAVESMNRLAHIVSWEIAHGPVEPGLQLDHLCRVRHCVNPAHLEPVTGQVNTLRGDTLPAANARKVECPFGHPYDAVNTLHSGGRRYCRACLARRKAERKARLAATSDADLDVIADGVVR